MYITRAFLINFFDNLSTQKHLFNLQNNNKKNENFNNTTNNNNIKTEIYPFNQTPKLVENINIKAIDKNNLYLSFSDNNAKLETIINISDFKKIIDLIYINIFAQWGLFFNL